MDLHLERRVALSEDSKFEGLYKWCLQELDEDGEQIGSDLVPWAWSAYFRVKEITCHDGLIIEPDRRGAPHEPKTKTAFRRDIRASLDPNTGFRDPCYSMFGTDRIIRSFSLKIEELPDGEGQELCWIWGGVSYTTEIDFRDETTPDAIEVHLLLRRDTFERYARNILRGEFKGGSLRLGAVDGFYSNWSPSISTDLVKVLTADKEHSVETAKGSEISPPRLGKVREVALDFTTHGASDPRKVEGQDDCWFDDDADEDDHETREPEVAEILARQSAQATTRAATLLTSVRAAAWLIALLLFLKLVL